jgi:type I restriction enzyme S subunit
VDVRRGYRRTEIGVIPKDWQIAQLGEKVTKVGSGLTPTGGMRVYRQEGRPFLRSQNVGWGNLLLDDVVFIDDETHATFRDTEINAGDVLLNITGASIGRSAVADVRVERGNVNQHVCIIRTSQTELHPRFLNYFLMSAEGQRQIDSFQAGGNRQGLNFAQVRSFRLPLPGIAEQWAIAEVLRDADAGIESLEELLAKKRQIKEGAMQELLRPKEGDSVRPLGDVSSLKGRIGWQGLKQAEFTGNDEEPFLITGMNFKDGAIRWEDVYHVSERRYSMAPDIQLRADDVLMTKDGTIGKVLYVDSIPYPGKASLNSHLLLFRPIGASYDPKYLYYQLTSRRFREFIEQRKSGTTFFGLSQAAIAAYPVVLPPLEEQVRRATILSDMDGAIACQEVKAGKARQVKQGMMQEFLTGQIRLPLAQAAANA